MALEAAADLERAGTSVEVIDPCSSRPLDDGARPSSVRKTGRLVESTESHPRCSVATDIVALVATRGLEYLDAPVRMVTGGHTPVPFSPVLENAYLPSTEKIIAAVKETFYASFRSGLGPAAGDSGPPDGGPHFMTIGLMGDATPFVKGSGCAARKDEYRPSLAQSAARRSRSKISPSVRPM